MSPDIAAIREAADPFWRVMAIQEPLNIPDDRPCATVWPTGWPTMGEMRTLLAAIYGPTLKPAQGSPEGHHPQ